MAYKNKLEYYEQSPTEWEMVNPGIKKPTFEEYVEQNPLLFVKNYWQQWVAFGEFDINLPAGCGKPVVYLYPSKPTDVTIKFLVPVQFVVDIPRYRDFWRVSARPDGSLINLRPELTSCQELDDSRRGSEYAKQACEKNVYPYIYWAGNVVSKNYPSVDRGWVVEREKLEVFLSEKLLEMGLSEKEREDFLSYWLDEMLNKKSPYYRVSFLQTEELNMLFPMQVSPRPDTVFRVFLDYEALSQRPTRSPEPQHLRRLIRKGFTLVEWGGLKRP